ncbi:MAG TPA: hypothetical protein VGK35_10585 [Actinotalea sp.]|jgi:hypothetical protein
MNDAPHVHSSGDDPETRAAELRDLAGPTHGRHAAPEPTTSHVGPVPSDTPDAETNPDIDEVRASEDSLPGNVEDEYQLRSMGTKPNPTEDDPGSYLNF